MINHEELDSILDELDNRDALSNDPVVRSAEIMLARLKEQGIEEATLEYCIETIEAQSGCDVEEELETGLRHIGHAYGGELV